MSRDRIRPYVVRTAGEVSAALLQPVLGRAVREPFARSAEVAGVMITERMLDVPDPFALDVVRERLLLDAYEAGVGLALISADRAALSPGLLVCDLDSTLVDGEGIDLLAAWTGRGEEVTRLTESAMRGERDFATALRERVRTLAGVTSEQVRQTADALQLQPGAEEATRAARAKGWKLAIASGGFEVLARPVAERTGALWVAAHALEERDGVLTGHLASGIVDGAEKAAFLGQCRKRVGSGVTVVAIGDGANDRAMFEAADVAVAYRPKPVLLQVSDAVSMHRDLRVAMTLAGVLGLGG